MNTKVNTFLDREGGAASSRPSPSMVTPIKREAGRPSLINSPIPFPFLSRTVSPSKVWERTPATPPQFGNNIAAKSSLPVIMDNVMWNPHSGIPNYSREEDHIFSSEITFWDRGAAYFT